MDTFELASLRNGVDRSSGISASGSSGTAAGGGVQLLLTLMSINGSRHNAIGGSGNYTTTTSTAIDGNSTALTGNDSLILAASQNVTGATSATAVATGIISMLPVQCLFGLVYAIIFGVGVTGNLLVCFVVCRNRAMHTVTNFFIANLAVSDILMCLLAVPFTPLYTFLGRWVFGTAMCHVVAAAQVVSVYVSSLTLTVIALDRYIVIMYPFRDRMRVSTCAWLIALCWFIAISFGMPYVFFVRVTNDPESGHSFCEENWHELGRKIFGTMTLTLQFIVPLLIISFCYIRVSRRLSSRARSKPGTKSAKKEEADRERKKRTNRMLMAMVAVFGVSWMPITVVNIVTDYDEMMSDRIMIAFFLSHCLAMSSTCYNPFLYAWLNENFRKEFRNLLPCLWRLTGDGGGGGGSGMGGGGRGGYNGFRAEQMSRSQADGMSVTRASEIIPRGPLCGSSIKKVLRSPMDGGGEAERKQAAAVHVEQTQTTEVMDCRDTNGNREGERAELGVGMLTAVTTSVGDLLETQFDGVTVGKEAEAVSVATK